MPTFIKIPLLGTEMRISLSVLYNNNKYCESFATILVFLDRPTLVGKALNFTVNFLFFL